MTQIWQQNRPSLDFFQMVPLVLLNQFVISSDVILALNAVGYELVGEGHLDELLDWGGEKMDGYYLEVLWGNLDNEFHVFYSTLDRT